MMESVMEVVEGYVDSRLVEMIVQLRELKDVATVKERQLLNEENKELKARVHYLEKTYRHK